MMAKIEPEDHSTTSSSLRNRRSDFLRNLPSYKSENFSRFSLESGGLRNAGLKKSKPYVPTHDHPCEQVIVTEKTSMLLRYLHNQWAKRQNQNSLKRRTHPNDEDSDENGNGNGDDATSSSQPSASGKSPASSSTGPRKKLPRTS